MRGLDRFIAFDAATRDFACGSGHDFACAQILTLIVPMRLVPADHAGDPVRHFGRRVTPMTRARKEPSPRRLFRMSCPVFWPLAQPRRIPRGRLSVDRDPRLFAATIGGLGLTGVIDWVESHSWRRVPSAFLEGGGAALPANLDEFWALAEESTTRFEHTVAWIDAHLTRREIRTRRHFSRANWHAAEGALAVHASEHTRRKKIFPLDAAVFSAQPVYGRRFQRVCIPHREQNRESTPEHVQALRFPFFYPLDHRTFHNWNRLYGAGAACMPAYCQCRP